MENSPTFNDYDHEKAWLLRVCANLCKNKISYNSYRYTNELNEQLVSQEQEDLSYVWEAVGKLTDIQKEVIHLFYHEGYKTAQIAEILSEKESTIRSHLKRARDKLKDILKEEYDFE